MYATPFTRSSVVTFVLLTIAVLACEEEPTRPVEFLPSPLTDMSALMPMFANNQWAYVDTHGVAVRLSLRNVEGYQEDGQGGWWQFSETDLGTHHYKVSRDSVRFYPKNGPGFSLQFLAPPAGIDTATFLRRYPFGNGHDTITVIRTTQSITVPAGTFDSILVYKWRSEVLRFTEYFKPGVGLLRRETDSPFDLPSSTTLVYYRIFK